MSLSDLSDPAAVRQALDEFDSIGREEFLLRYGFGKSRRYMLVEDGKRYDAKAIAGAAHGFQHPDEGPLKQSDFTSGLHTVVPKLRSLGFEIEDEAGGEPDNPDGERSAFLFNASPKHYDIDAAIRELEAMNWGVKQHRNDIHAGDRVYIWRSGSGRGIVAFGTILTDPATMPDQEGQRFIRNAGLFEGEQLRVRLSIDRVLDPPLGEDELRRHPVLKDLRVLKLANNTNYLLTPAQEQALSDLVEEPEATDPLRRRFEEFLEESGYPTERDLAKRAQREELAAALSEENLSRAIEDPGEWDALLFGQLAHKAYGDPGNQSMFNRHIADSNEAKGAVAGALRYLLYGPGDEIDRLDETLSHPYRVPGFSESLTTKALAVAFPERWLPLYQYDGKMGKLSLMAAPELHLEPPADLEQRSLATKIALTNDALRRRVEPLLPGDPWGQMVFLYWLRERGRDEREPAVAAKPYRKPPFEEIESTIAAVGMTIDSRTLLRYHLSLEGRGFVILSGLSGAGKTWLSELYAEAVEADHLLVSVAPNWTTNEDLLGYLNPLTETFQHTELSVFLGEAEEEWWEAQEEQRPARPFHVTLDEMNLARVEYYFARFLSAMEVRSRNGSATLELGPDERAELTPNLRFTGTVNVDETTHGFADKVYDRAQLLELPVSREAIVSHLEGAPYRDLLLEVWDAVNVIAPFAFRVVDEIGGYVASSEEVREGWESPLDEQILQKVLPKVKGTDLRTGPALEALIEVAGQTLPLTRTKAEAMHEGFRQHGFASYF